MSGLTLLLSVINGIKFFVFLIHQGQVSYLIHFSFTALSPFECFIRSIKVYYKLKNDNCAQCSAKIKYNI